MVAVERELPVGDPPASGSQSVDGIPRQLRRHGGSPRQVFAMSLIGALVLACLASRDLVSWLDRMGGGAFVEPIQHAAARWDGAMEQLGLVRPHEALRTMIGELLDRQW